jgi:transcriptional adapter 3
LGRHYLQVWAEEDRALIPNFEQSDTDRTKQESHIGGQPEQILTDELLETDAISCGPLTERIVSALIKNNVGIPADYGRSIEDNKIKYGSS